MVTLDERKSKLRLAMPVVSKKARDVTNAVIRLFGFSPEFVGTKKMMSYLQLIALLR